MKKHISCLLVGYGGIVAVLGLLTQACAPDLARPSLLAGLVGGSLSVLWGLLGLAGRPRRGWAIFTMATTGFVLLSQVVSHWMPSGEPKSGTRGLALLATVMFIHCCMAWHDEQTAEMKGLPAESRLHRESQSEH